MEERKIAENLELKLSDNLKGTFDLWIDENGYLEIVPLFNGGDIGSWSYVFAKNIHEDYRLYSKQIEFEGEED